jgi:YggT family protein
VNSLSCSAAQALGFLLRIFWFAMLAYAVASWVPSLRGRWSDYLARVIEPVLGPVRRIIPPLGGLDIAFLVVLILVGWLASTIPSTVCVYYY